MRFFTLGSNTEDDMETHLSGRVLRKIWTAKVNKSF